MDLIKKIYYKYFPASKVLGYLLTRRFFNRPIFVGGAGRSGTTILWETLNTHPLIISTFGEAPLMPYIGEIAYKFYLSSINTYIKKSTEFTEKEIEKILRKFIFESKWGAKYGCKRAISRFAWHSANLLKKRLWAAKTFPDENMAKGLVYLYPDAKFIYIHRNGIENVLSRTKYPGFKNQSFEDHCKTWANAEQKYRYLLNWEKSYEIPHSDFVNKRNYVLNKLVEFIGIPYSDNMEKYAKSTMIHPLDKNTAVVDNVTNVLNTRDQYWKKWKREQKVTFKKLCDESMDYLGYDIPF